MDRNKPMAARSRAARPILDAQAHTLASSPTAVHQRVIPFRLRGPDLELRQRLGKRPVLAVLGLLAALVFGRKVLARK